MTEHVARQLIVNALKAANVMWVRDNPRVEEYLAGDRDIEIDELGLDSLATMEFCIDIEVNAGVSIVPDSIRKMVSLGHLATIIEEQLP